MALKSINPTATVAWENLRTHFQELFGTTMLEMFENDSDRISKMHVRWNELLFDYSKNIVTEETMRLLFNLANEVDLKDAIQKYFEGDSINETEGRAVLHTALRSSTNSLIIDEVNIMEDIRAVKERIRIFTEAIVSGEHKGYTGKPITDVVNIGIGGSDLGPAMVVEALKYYKNHLNCHFVSNVDGDQVHELLKIINPETTLFVIVSKTFTTQETLTNAETVRNWFLQSAKKEDISKHFVAVSTNLQKVSEFGIQSQYVFPMWDWVGGRFSLWSAVGMSISLSIGFDHFDRLLLGANSMDQHFKETEFENNIPVILALLSVWYNNFFIAETEAIIPYTHYLQKLAPYLQQGIMESNGKSISRDGNPVNYQTGTVIWGEPGSNSQHAFFQLIHQGTKLIPADFIGFKNSLHADTEHHNKLMSNFFAQTEALMTGKSEEVVRLELIQQGLSHEQIERLLPFKVFEGNKPTNTFLWNKLDAYTLGQIIAMYEHKIFVQGVIWNIFSYDQWGVELGKQLANSILKDITTGEIGNHDASTSFLISEFIKGQH